MIIHVRQKYYFTQLNSKRSSNKYLIRGLDLFIFIFNQKIHREHCSSFRNHNFVGKLGVGKQVVDIVGRYFERCTADCCFEEYTVDY